MPYYVALCCVMLRYVMYCYGIWYVVCDMLWCMVCCCAYYDVSRVMLCHDVLSVVLCYVVCYIMLCLFCFVLCHVACYVALRYRLCVIPCVTLFGMLRCVL